MMRIPVINRPVSRVVVFAVAAVAGFGVLAFFVPAEKLTVLMNGVFAGTIAALAVAYWKLIWNATLGIRPYDRVRQMTLGFALSWVAILLGVYMSIYYRVKGIDTNASYLVAFTRYIASIAAVLQVSAPDFGLGLFHGRERKTLWTGIGVGLVVAITMILAQDYSILE